jgi:hypothetical protein
LKNYVKSLTGNDYSPVDREEARTPRQVKDYRIMLPEELDAGRPMQIIKQTDIGRMPGGSLPEWW